MNKKDFVVNWDEIEEMPPDETDIKMLQEIENNPECKQFLSSADVLSELGL